MQAPQALRVGNVLLESRPMRLDEGELVVRYFLEASAADLERMGVDPSKLPQETTWMRSLRALLSSPPPKSSSAYCTWLVDGVAIGHSSFKDVKVGEGASQHLHMWSAQHRGRGFGPVLFCLSALQAYERFQLRHLVCEPAASNPMPNSLLRKVGFPVVRTYEGASSDLSKVTRLNRYSIERDIAQTYLDSVAD